MSKESFILYKSFWGPISELTHEQLGRLFKAIFEYHIAEDHQVEVDADIRMAFAFFVNQFRIDEAKYEQIIQARSQAGRLGNRKRWHGDEPIASVANATNESQTSQPIASVADNVNDNDNENVKGKKKSIKKISVKPKYSLDFIGDPVLRGIVNEWLEYKKHRGESYRDQNSVEKMVTSLGDLSGCDIEKARRIVDQSMANNWAGLFALKEKEGGQSPEKRDIYMEKARKILEQ